MLCRRCGLESSTTDVCEWCSRPMLPAGATVSGRAAKELKKSGGPIAAPPKLAVGEETGVPLGQGAPQETVEQAAETDADAQPQAPDVLLRPLGHAGDQAPPAPPQQGQAPRRIGMPSHGLSQDATKTSVDISQYLGADDSIFRPIEREGSYSSAASLDRVARKSKLLDQSGSGPDLTENQRLGRSLIAGLAIGVVLSIVQFVATGKAIDTLYGLRLGRGENLMTALMYGIASGLLLGLGLGAILTRLRKGPFIGLVIGLAVASGFKNLGWAHLAGALTGIIAGRFATIGVRRVVNV